MAGHVSRNRRKEDGVHEGFESYPRMRGIRRMVESGSGTKSFSLVAARLSDGGFSVGTLAGAPSETSCSAWWLALPEFLGLGG